MRFLLRRKQRLVIIVMCSCLFLGVLLLRFETGKSRILVNGPRFVLQKAVGDALGVGRKAVEEYLFKAAEPAPIDARRVQLHPLHDSFKSLFVIVDTVKFNIPADNNASFVVVVPRRIIKGKHLEIFDKYDKQATMFAGNLLNSLSEFDGMACLPRAKQKSKEGSNIFNSSWCNFKKRDWSIQIRNNGEVKKFLFETLVRNSDSRSSPHISMIQMCNIIRGPFIVRKNKYMAWKGLKHNFGRLSLLDFFVRTGGHLKIGKSSDCFYNDDLYHLDRGRLNGDGDFPEYSNFGVAHNVLRIIMEDRIEWTKCVVTDKLCKEEPYKGPPTTLPQIAQPICCSVMLNQILKDSVAVFTKLGIQYKVVFGTLLGAERSGSIIPYTRDIDFTLESKYSHNQDSYASLQKHYGDKYSISGHSFFDFPRLIPLMPIHLNITTAPFFKDEFDLEGDKFFSNEINQTAHYFLPFTETAWNTRAYADFYKSPVKYFNGSSMTVINGARYAAAEDKHADLVKYYGIDWKTPAHSKLFSGHSDSKSHGAVEVLP